MSFVIMAVFSIMSILFLKKEWRLTNQIYFISIMILGGIVATFLSNLYMIDNEVISKGRTVFPKIDPWIGVGLFFSMIIGMLSKYFFDAIGPKGNFSFNKWSMIRPVFISPIVFLTVVSVINNDEINLLTFIFSFQNGFFWQTMLAHRANSGKAN